MQIKELARATGVDVETIRYYEKQGLMPAPARRDNGYRDYAAAHLERLSFIRHCRALDMPLGDVVAEFNRFNRQHLVVRDPDTAAILVGGNFRADNVDGFVRLLEAGFDVQTEPQGGSQVLLRRKR